MPNKNTLAPQDLDEFYKESPGELEQEKDFYFNPEAGDQVKKPASALALPKSNSMSDTPTNAPRKKPKNSVFKKLALFLLLAGLLTVGFLLWQAYNNLANPIGQGSEIISLKITGPKEVVSGEPTEYQIIFENKSDVLIKEAEVNVRFPSNFVALNFEPKPNNQASEAGTNIKIAQYFWQFSSLPPGAKKELLISGQTFGEIGSTQIITASCHFEPENFSSDFKVSSLLETEITDTLVKLKIEAPTEIVAGAEAEYLIKISPFLKNSATTSLKDLYVYIEYPLGFNLSRVETEIEEHPPSQSPPNTNASWLIPELDQEKEIKIAGTLSGEAGEYKELLIKVGYYAADEFQLQAGESFITLIIKPELDLELKVNGLKTDSLSTDWTEEIEYTLTAKNNGEAELTDIIFKLNFSGDALINWSSATCPRAEDCDFLLTNTGDDSIKTLIWTRDQLDQLTDLEGLSPDESITIKLKFNLNENPVTQKENYHLLAQAEADLKIPGLKDSLLVESNEITLKIKTQVNLETEARYYTDEGLKIGSGPLPPLVGAATSFRIFWKITNTSNSLKNVQVITTLPDNVSWLNKTQPFLGALKYDASSREVIWTIPLLVAYPGESARANFEISVTPTLNQLGEYLTLTEETVLEATDNFTNESVSAYAGYLTSELENDLVAQGKGRVE